ncbi:response regulator [Labrys sp. KB_33_2]|uniref:response regulator n=1 Tax=Labrys sp. KB_33_2 TaxID=3237479 RepID=UPI003F8F857E
MSIAAEIAPQLPYLRRFSRALSGSQASGDAYVVETLEALVADPASFPRALPPRIALYQVFLRLWSSLSLNMEPAKQVEGISPEQRLERLAPRSRQAFLLTTMEGFASEEAATIMRIDEKEVIALVTEATEDVARQIATEILIIEDEPIIALDLQSIVEELGHRVVGIARTHAQALARVREHPPGLILADIQLADGSSGLKAVNEILASVELPVIFITAYPERLLTGQQPEPAFLITKPFRPEIVKATISQALFFDKRASLRPA